MSSERPLPHDRTSSLAALLAGGEGRAHHTVLVADDDTAVRRVVSLMLEQAGYRVVPACDGDEALRLYSGSRRAIGCIVLDVCMPRMDGLATLAALRRIDPGLRTVLVSALAPPAGLDVHKDAIAGFLQKPFVMSDLILAVDRAVAAS
ncbi:MAG: response regulator [Planctomycetes bacterium]|nr:response regulator [Planctomycetota bacterium]